MNYKAATLFTVFIFLTIFGLSAQDTTTDQERRNQIGLEYRTFRVAFIPGLSTNGIAADEYASKYSFNILAGYNGALENGYELGGIANINRYYANGLQVAALANYSGEETAGVQIAGLANISREEMQGIQIAGIGNYADDDMQGIQISGAFNWSGGASQGIQISGAANYARSDMQGMLITGAANITRGSMQGIAASGAVNYADGDMQGIMVAGALNLSASFQGIATAPINLSQEFQGIQAGAINVAEYGQGLQIGVINYAREFEGVPVGLLSFYEDGRSEIDLWTSDGGFSNVGLKLGTEEIYNMISIGYNPLLEGDVWQLGWSIGRLKEYENHFTYSDFSYFKINEGGWTSDLNSILKYRILFGKDFGKGFQLYGGPTLNMMISKLDSSNRYTWYNIFIFGARGREYTFWIGYSVGVELF